MKSRQSQASEQEENNLSVEIVAKGKMSVPEHEVCVTTCGQCDTIIEAGGDRIAETNDVRAAEKGTGYSREGSCSR